MAQVPATRHSSPGGAIDYTPGSAVTAGDVLVLGDVVAVATQDIAANALGALEVSGVFKVPKITGALTVGVLVYWDPAGDPVSGDAGTGAATGTAGALKRMGYAALAAGANDAFVYVLLSRP